MAAHLKANELARRPVVHRATVMVLLGESPDDIDDVLALSVPDAHRLVARLQAALDAPLQLRK